MTTLVSWDDGTNSTSTWHTWCVSTCSNATTTNMGAWGAWMLDTAFYGEPVPIKPPSEEHLQRIRDERAAESRRYQAKLEENRRKQAEANAKAEALLRSMLTEEQQKTWTQGEQFDVVAPSGNIYRITKGSHGNILRLVRGRPVERLCVQPGGVPTADINLAQMLHLMHDEDGVRRLAGITQLAA